MTEKIKFRCGSCNWKFMRAFKPKLCPYCGKDAVAEDTTASAEELLRDVE